MLNKGQLFKDVTVILFFIWIVIVSVCIIDIYYKIDIIEGYQDIFHTCLDTLQEVADLFFDHIHGRLWIEL